MLEPERRLVAVESEASSEIELPQKERDNVTIFLGKIGSREIVEVKMDYIIGPDGSIGLPAQSLRRLAAEEELTADSIIWVRAENVHAETPISEITELSEVDRLESINLADDRLVIDISRHEVRVDDKKLRLSKTDYEILLLLAQNQGVVLKREEIYSKVWNTNWTGSIKSLDVHVSTIRGTLKSNGIENLIETVRSVGFIIERPASKKANFPADRVEL